MALTGTLDKVTPMKTKQGNDYVLVEINYKNGPWKLSTFDEVIRQAIEELSIGDEVSFETEKRGKHTNLAGIAPLGKTIKTATQGSKETRKAAAVAHSPATASQKDHAITLIALLKSFIEAGAIKKPSEIDAWGYMLASTVIKINAGDYLDSNVGKDDEVPF